MFSDQDLEFNSYIYYNKDLFKKAGIEAPDVAYSTWDEFYEACDTLKAKGITPASMDSADLGWLSNLWYSGLIGTAGDEGNTFMNTQYPTAYNIPCICNCKRKESIRKIQQG